MAQTPHFQVSLDEKAYRELQRQAQLLEKPLVETFRRALAAHRRYLAAVSYEGDHRQLDPRTDPEVSFALPGGQEAVVHVEEHPAPPPPARTYLTRQKLLPRRALTPKETS